MRLSSYFRIVANSEVTPFWSYFLVADDSTETLDSTPPFLDKRVGDTLGLFFRYGNIRPIFSCPPS
jgi:hypothetical protein